MQSARLAVAGLLAISAFGAQAATTTTVVDVPFERGTIRIAHTRPDVPKANIILLTGGLGTDAIPDLQTNGDGAHPNFFFNIGYRTRPLFAELGYSFVYVDVASDRRVEGLTWDYRVSSTHLQELRAVLDYVRQRDNVPTWVWGFSTGSISAVNMALGLPADKQFGLVLLASVTVPANVPGTIFDLNLAGVRRPTLVLSHAEDPCPNGPPAMASSVAERLTSAPVRQHIVFTGGTGDTRPIICDSTGHHGLGGQDAEFVATVVDWTTKYAYLAQEPNYTALWWNPAESGWGINFNHQGDILFATLYTYDSTGQPLWLVMSEGRLQPDGSTFAGTLYRTTGPAFNAVPFTPIGAANLTTVGTLSVTFSGARAGTLTYSFNGASVTKSIQANVYGSRAANCMTTTASRASLTNYQDLWWNAAESGWGVNITHQDHTLFATLYTYDATGRDLWLVMSAGVRQADGSYLGDLYRTTGPAFNAMPFTPIGPANLNLVGTMRFTFSSGTSGRHDLLGQRRERHEIDHAERVLEPGAGLQLGAGAIPP